MPLNRHWEMGPLRGTKLPPPYHLHRTMLQVIDHEVIARRDAAEAARYRATLRKTSPTKEQRDGEPTPKL